MDLLREYKRGLKPLAVEEVFDLIFYRPLAFLFVLAVRSTGVTPNQLTLLGTLFGVLGGVSLALGSPAAIAAGGAFFLLYNILDCSDGQLARMNGTGTHLGRILDGVGDYVVSVAAYLGIGIGYAGASDDPLLMWSLTAAAGLSNAAQSGLLDYQRKKYLDAAGAHTGARAADDRAFREEYEVLRGQKGKAFERFIIGVYLLYTRVQVRAAGNRETVPVALNAPGTEHTGHEKILMHFWTCLGPTTQWTLLVVCAFAGRLDMYLWGIAGVGNILALVMLLVQRASNAHLAVQGGA